MVKALKSLYTKRKEKANAFSFLFVVSVGLEPTTP